MSTGHTRYVYHEFGSCYCTCPAFKLRRRILELGVEVTAGMWKSLSADERGFKTAGEDIIAAANASWLAGRPARKAVWDAGRPARDALAATAAAAEAARVAAAISARAAVRSTEAAAAAAYCAQRPKRQRT